MAKTKIEYPQDVDTVYAFVTDPEEIKKRSLALGEMNPRVQVDDAGGTKTVTNTREIESDLPAFAKKLFNPTNTVVERSEWRDDGDRKICKRHIDIKGTPGTIDFNITISPNGTGSTYDIEFEATAKIPLIRKKLEELITNLTLEGIREEHDYNKKQLAAQARS